jgi:hypothetical protein
VLSVVYLVQHFALVPILAKKVLFCKIILEKIVDFYSVIVCSSFINISILNSSLLKYYVLLVRKYSPGFQRIILP